MYAKVFKRVQMLCTPVDASLRRMALVNLQYTQAHELEKKLHKVQTDRAVLVDLRYSRLTSANLSELLNWLLANDNASVCVGFTNIGFNELCRELMRRFNTLDWVESGRLCSGTDDSSRHLDKLHA